MPVHLAPDLARPVYFALALPVLVCVALVLPVLVCLAGLELRRELANLERFESKLCPKSTECVNSEVVAAAGGWWDGGGGTVVVGRRFFRCLRMHPELQICHPIKRDLPHL